MVFTEEAKWVEGPRRSFWKGWKHIVFMDVLGGVSAVVWHLLCMCLCRESVHMSTHVGVGWASYYT